MDLLKLSADDKSTDTRKVQKECTDLNDITALQRANIKMVQNILLIWLDSSIDENNIEYQNIITQLRCVVNNINTFTDEEECTQFINSIVDNKVCVLISGSLGQHIVPHIHNMPQVDSIFLTCANKEHHDQWIKEWPKVNGVFTEIIPICEALKQVAQQCEQNAISISFMPVHDDAPSINLDRLDPMFMYTQIIKEILLTIHFESKHIKEFSDYCRAAFSDNASQLAHIDRFQENYRDKTPIWWYTGECFLYSLLNRALRISDVDIIIRMGFFIGDLHRHIEELHRKQFDNHLAGTTLTVYRGQGLSKTDFEGMLKTREGLISFNNFLSTSKDRNVSLAFTESIHSNPDLIGILFVMTIDPSKSSTPFASINTVSNFWTEQEVLFSMHTVFRIDDIKPMSENLRLFQVELTLTSEDDKNLVLLTNHIRQETFPHLSGCTDWVQCFINGLLRKAQRIYESSLIRQRTRMTEHQFTTKWRSQQYNKGSIKKQ